MAKGTRSLEPLERLFDTCSMARDLRHGSFGAPANWDYQAVRNIEWPPDGVARLLPERRPVPVHARVVWERDGEEWVPGQAVRWLRPVVFVLLSDDRYRGAGAWLPAADVRRPGEPH